MKILLLDIETAPNLAYVWQLYDQNIGPKQVVSGTYVLCWAAKWYGEDEILFDSIHQSKERSMLRGIHNLLDEADVVVHFYGSKFDIPMLNGEFIKHGMTPPSPYKQVDLKKVCADQFRFPSNKLEYVAKALKIGTKIDTDFKLWTDCLKGNEDAWAKMKEYNKNDTILLEALYDKLMPWISNHPNHGAFGEDKEVCPNCGGSHLHRRGIAIANLLKYPRFQCQSCWKWFRSNMAIPNKKKIKRYVNV